MKIYQKHTIVELENGELVHNHSYVLAENAHDVCFSTTHSPINEHQETYALEVTEQTILDEITHCEELIEYWKSKDSVRYVTVIIDKQLNLIKYYKSLIAKFKKGT